MPDRDILDILGGLSPTEWLKARLVDRAAGQPINDDEFCQVALATAFVGLVEKGVDEDLALTMLYGPEDGSAMPDWTVSCSWRDGEFELNLERAVSGEYDDLPDGLVDTEEEGW